MTMNSPFLVTPQWLAQHINDENLVVIDVRMSPVGLTPKKDMLAEFERGHIPGAVYFDIDEVADKNTALPHMLPTAAEFGVAVGKLGISERDTLVIYDEGNQFSAPRGWWALPQFRRPARYVLDEGLNGWAALGQALETGPAQPEPQTFNARFNADAVVNMRQVEQALGTPVQILDARRAALLCRSAGAAPRPAPRSYSRQHQHSVRRAAGERPLQIAGSAAPNLQRQGRGHQRADHHQLRLRRDGGGTGVRPAVARRAAGQAV